MMLRGAWQLESINYVYIATRHVRIGSIDLRDRAALLGSGATQQQSTYGQTK